MAEAERLRLEVQRRSLLLPSMLGELLLGISAVEQREQDGQDDETMNSPQEDHQDDRLQERAEDITLGRSHEGDPDDRRRGTPETGSSTPV